MDVAVNEESDKEIALDDMAAIAIDRDAWAERAVRAESELSRLLDRVRAATPVVDGVVRGGIWSIVEDYPANVGRERTHWANGQAKTKADLEAQAAGVSR